MLVYCCRLISCFSLAGDETINARLHGGAMNEMCYNKACVWGWGGGAEMSLVSDLQTASLDKSPGVQRTLYPANIWCSDQFFLVLIGCQVSGYRIHCGNDGLL